MNRQRTFQPTTAPAQQPHRRAYTIHQVCEALALNRRTFFHLRRRGQLPMLEELRPRLGRTVRYRADLVDRYLSGEWPSAVRHEHQSRVGVRPTPIS